ncbi:hypothetical protein IWQ49_006359 [Labrenzia sp. EL_126]|nr:hypothetical protein [Labrenzia sp. EL_126]
MANFDPPLASVGGVNRSPTTDEQSDGFSCGAADQTLFNRLFGRIEAELKAIQDEGGIAGSEADDTTVLQAIQAMISAATGGGDTSQFVLFSQAQARFPVFPEVTTNNGIIGVTAPSTGTVRVPAGAQVLHRGIGLYTSVQTDFATVASKTYHLRWNKDDGFALKDLSDVAYNAGTLSEDNIAFDSSYDDMLVTRIVTNSSNVATITNLLNKHQMESAGEQYFIDVAFQDDEFPSAISNYSTVDLNWSRTPFATANGATDGPANAEWNFGAKPLSRYQIAVYSQTSVGGNGEYISWQAWR